MEKYRPSNGSEGDWFIDKYCMRCIHCDPNPEGKKQCEILMRSLVYSVDEPEYPSEWTYDDKDQPICTEWKKWDWGNDGDPDDPDNPNAPIPVGPNQLVLPFLYEGMEDLENQIILENEKYLHSQKAL